MLNDIRKDTFFGLSVEDDLRSNLSFQRAAHQPFSGRSHLREIRDAEGRNKMKQACPWQGAAT
jgi:hypothetical protein